MKRPLGIIYRRNSTLGASARVFLEMLINDAASESTDAENKKSDSGK
jgi:hypothetical protein